MKTNYDIKSKKNTHPLKSKIQIGSRINFKRQDSEIEGIVVLLRENSVMVEIDPRIAETLDYSTEFTIVNYKNIRVLEQVSDTQVS